MRIFIVHAHPEAQSFSASMCRRAAELLSEAGHSVEVSALYAMGFNPVASVRDFEGRARTDYLVYALEQRHGFKEGGGSHRTSRPRMRSSWAAISYPKLSDLLVLDAAILKGWIDRLLLSGPCYGGLRFYDRGGLVGKKASVTATLGGRTHMFGEHAVHGQLNDMLRHLLRGTLAYTGCQVLEPFYAYHVPYLPEEDRAQILQEFSEAVVGFDSRASLPTFTLDEFDERLNSRPRTGF